MKTKNLIGFIMGLAVAGLQVPGMVLVFSSANEWNLAAVLLTALMLATVVFAIIAAVFSITGKKAFAMYIAGGITGAANLLLMIYMLFSIEVSVITAAASVILLFVAAKSAAKT